MDYRGDYYWERDARDSPGSKRVTWREPIEQQNSVSRQTNQSHALWHQATLAGIRVENNMERVMRRGYNTPETY